MEKYTFQNFMKKVMKVAVCFANTKNAVIKYQNPVLSEDDKYIDFKMGESHLEKSIFYKFINDSDNKFKISLMFSDNYYNYFMVHIFGLSDLCLPLISGKVDELIVSRVFNDATNNNLYNIEGKFEDRLRHYLEIMWDPSKFLEHAILKDVINYYKKNRKTLI